MSSNYPLSFDQYFLMIFEGIVVDFEVAVAAAVIDKIRVVHGLVYG
jgi:hypothetical protein